MTESQPALLIEGAYQRLEIARATFAAGLHGSAAREAYLAALSAARAVIFARSASAPKTHRGSIALFHKIAVVESAFDRSLAAFLAEGFEIKQSVDYEPIPLMMDASSAQAALDSAERFIKAVEELLQ